MSINGQDAEQQYPTSKQQLSLWALKNTLSGKHIRNGHPHQGLQFCINALHGQRAQHFLRRDLQIAGEVEGWH